jgi:large subunit ribosomal protein L22
MAFGAKTNEREGTRAVLRHTRIAPNKIREVLNLVREKPVHEAEDILRFSERDAATIVGKVLHSAVANAENNDGQDPEELYVSACYADEGTTIKRWRPRARGRATRIRKRTSHVTVIVSRLPEERLERLQARRRAEQLAQRSRRVAGARRTADDTRTRAERRRRGAPDELEPTETTDLETADVETSDAETTDVDTTESAAEIAATAEESGVVDTEALAVAEAEAGEVTETAADEAAAEMIADTEAGRIAAAEEEAGIVDTTATAVAAAEADDTVAENNQDEGE